MKNTVTIGDATVEYLALVSGETRTDNCPIGYDGSYIISCLKGVTTISDQSTSCPSTNNLHKLFIPDSLNFF